MIPVIDRLKEPSTWAGLAALATLAGVNLRAEEVAAVAQLGGALSAFLAVILREKSAP